MHRHLIAAFLAALLALPASAQDRIATLHVSGTGTVEAAPDIARLTIGVVAESATAAAAAADVAADLTRVQGALTAAGIAAADLQTTTLRIDPQQTYRDGDSPRITGYVARSEMTATVRQLDTLSALLDVVITEGANTLNGLQFDLADRRPLQDRARAAAVADARRAAEVLAEAAGLELGQVRSLREGGTSAPPMPMMRSAMAESAAIPVATGEISVTATVEIVYAVTPAE